MTASSTESPVVKARRDQIGTVAEILTKAFDDDPVLNWFMRQDHRRGEAIATFFDVLGKTIYAPHDECFLMNDGSGATMWLPPGISNQTGPWETLKQLPAVLRMVRFRGIPRLLRVQSLVEGAHPHEPHYYLFGIGTLPGLRGRGIGSTLMKPMTERMDREQMPGYLENSKEQNLPFYERHGFRVMKQLQMPGGGPPLWPMWREPK